MEEVSDALQLASRLSEQLENKESELEDTRIFGEFDSKKPKKQNSSFTCCLISVGNCDVISRLTAQRLNKMWRVLQKKS